MYKSKRAALELSVGTIVVIVLAMSMLILGLVLIRTIFSGAKYNVDIINEKVQGEINKLFEEQGGRLYIYLPNSQTEVKKGDSFGVAFSVKNDVIGETKAGKFTYEAKAGSIQEGCPISKQVADSYLVLGKSGQFSLLPGQQLSQSRVIKVQPPSTAPLCEISYDLIIKKDNQPYETGFFIIKITS